MYWLRLCADCCSTWYLTPWLLILGKPAAQLVLAWNITSTSINAVTSTLVSVAIYMPLRSALIRAGLFDRLR